MSEVFPLLIRGTGLSRLDIQLILANAPSRYKHFTIKKRNGGDRKIAQPARELKALQRAFIAGFLVKLPIHPAATAYRFGKSIKDNAEAHAGKGPILKYDFSDFFPSIRSRDWQKYCDRHHLLEDPNDRYATERLLFCREKGSRILRLSVGAPSSPILSNILMFHFDDAITGSIAGKNIRYTRYADDLTFSSSRTGYLNDVERIVRRAIRDAPFPSLSLNEEKTTLATSKFRRQVTGLVLPNQGGVSLGRDRKRMMRAMIHRAITGELSPSEMSHLCGLLGFAHDVEPEFVIRMEHHYGSEAIAQIKRFANVSRDRQLEY